MRQPRRVPKTPVPPAIRRAGLRALPRQGARHRIAPLSRARPRARPVALLHARLIANQARARRPRADAGAVLVRHRGRPRRPTALPVPHRPLPLPDEPVTRPRVASLLLSMRRGGGNRGAKWNSASSESGSLVPAVHPCRPRWCSANASARYGRNAPCPTAGFHTRGGSRWSCGART